MYLADRKSNLCLAKPGPIYELSGGLRVPGRGAQLLWEPENEHCYCWLFLWLFWARWGCLKPPSLDAPVFRVLLCPAV